MKNPFDSDERRAFRETVARFVKHEIEPHAEAWDEAGTFPWEVHEKACALGLFGFGIDEQYGGLGFEDAFMRAASAEELGRGGIGGVIAAIGSRGIMVGLVNALAAEPIKARALPEILSGVKGGAFLREGDVAGMNRVVQDMLALGSISVDELTEALTLVQTGKTRKMPIILVHEPFWRGLLDWMRERLVAEKMINPEDLDLIQVIDDPNAIVDTIFKHYEKRNFTPSQAERETFLNL